MKFSYLTMFCLCVMCSVGGIQVTHAGTVAGFGGATEPTQWLNNFGIGADTAANTTGAAFEGAQVTKAYALDTLANQIQGELILSFQKDVTNWAKSGFYGTPTFVQNPDTFFSNIRKNTLRVQLNSIKGITGNANTDALIKDLVINERWNDKDIAQKLQSQLPGIISSSVCTDASLSDLARQDIGARSQLGVITADQVIAQNLTQAVNARKQELWNSLCGTGSINVVRASPSQLTQTAQVSSAQASAQAAARAKAQEDLFKKNFQAGGWPAWLALADARNTDQGRAQIAKDAVATAQAKNTQQQQQELNQSGGYLGKRECVEAIDYVDEMGVKIDLDQAQNDPTLCKKYKNTAPGKDTSDTVTKSNSAPADRLTNTSGLNAIMSAVMSGIRTRFTMELSGLARDVFSSSPSKSGSQINSVKTDTLDDLLTGKANNTTVTTQAPEVDINASNTPEFLTRIIKSMQNDLLGIDKLTAQAQIGYAQLKRYQPSYDEYKTCDSVGMQVAKYRTQEPGLSIHASFLERQTEYEPALEKFTTINSKTDEYKTKTNDYLSRIRAAKSTEEVNKIYSAYESEKSDSGLPAQGSDAMLTVDVERIKTRISQDLSNNGGGKNISALIQDCQAQLCGKYYVRLDGSKTCTEYTTDPVRISNPIYEQEPPINGGGNDGGGGM